MTNGSIYDLGRVVETLTSSSTSLRELAENTGFDVFTFYQKAELRGLDLTGQDLRDMNFFGADLRSTTGTNFLADPGSFNGAITNSEALVDFQDEYDSFLDDILDNRARRVYYFVSYREGVIDRFMRDFNVPQNTIATNAKISAPTVRKARRSERITADSAVAITNSLKSLVDQRSSLNSSFLRQPVLSLWQLKADGSFKKIDRERFATLLEWSVAIYQMRVERNPSWATWNFRDGPGMIEWLIKYYSADPSSVTNEMLFAPVDELPLFATPVDD